jgi:hypothetical protein
MDLLPPVKDSLFTLSVDGGKRKGYNIYHNISGDDSIREADAESMFDKCY